MTVPTTISRPAAMAAAPVRRISGADLNDALRDGLRDFIRHRGDLLLVGLIYSLIGLVTAAVSLGTALVPFFFPVVLGVALLGPVAALGFYEIARRTEAGLESDWSHFLDVRKRPNCDAIVAAVGLLVVIFFVWLAVAGSLYTLLMGPAPDTIGDFVHRLFTTTEGWTLIVVGNLIGFVFAASMLALSVVSLPMLVDRNVGARTALATSWAAARANKAEMARWGVTVLALLVVASIPAFIGLAFVLPWLGYATWHLYTKLVDRSGLPTG